MSWRKQRQAAWRRERRRQAGLVCHCLALLIVFLLPYPTGVLLRVTLPPLRAAAVVEMSAPPSPDGAGGQDLGTGTASHAESDAAGAARGAPRMRVRSESPARGAAAADAAAHAAAGLGAPVEMAVHAAPAPAAPLAPTVGTEEQVLGYFAGLEEHVLRALQARSRLDPPLPPLPALR